MSNVTRSLMQKSELSAARLALVSDAPVARRVQSDNAAIRAENEHLKAENELLQELNDALQAENDRLVEVGENLKQENELLAKENVAMSAKLNRPAFLTPRKGRLPAREEVEETGARVLELDDDEPEPEPKLEPETVLHGTQKLVKVTRRKDAS
jgi:hypothetical protein